MAAAFGLQIKAQDKIEHPEISYAGTPRTVTIGGINVSGVDGYGITCSRYFRTHRGPSRYLPGNEITDAVKRYWRHGLFSNVSISVDSLINNRHICISV